MESPFESKSVESTDTGQEHGVSAEEVAASSLLELLVSAKSAQKTSWEGKVGSKRPQPRGEDGLPAKAAHKKGHLGHQQQVCVPTVQSGIPLQQDHLHGSWSGSRVNANGSVAPSWSAVLTNSVPESTSKAVPFNNFPSHQPRKPDIEVPLQIPSIYQGRRVHVQNKGDSSPKNISPGSSLQTSSAVSESHTSTGVVDTVHHPNFEANIPMTSGSEQLGAGHCGGQLESYDTSDIQADPLLAPTSRFFEEDCRPGRATQQDPQIVAENHKEIGEKAPTFPRGKSEDKSKHVVNTAKDKASLRSSLVNSQTVYAKEHDMVTDEAKDHDPLVRTPRVKKNVNYRDFHRAGVGSDEGGNKAAGSPQKVESSSTGSPQKVESSSSELKDANESQRLRGDKRNVNYLSFHREGTSNTESVDKTSGSPDKAQNSSEPKVTSLLQRLRSELTKFSNSIPKSCRIRPTHRSWKTFHMQVSSATIAGVVKKLKDLPEMIDDTVRTPKWKNGSANLAAWQTKCEKCTVESVAERLLNELKTHAVDFNLIGSDDGVHYGVHRPLPPTAVRMRKRSHAEDDEASGESDSSATDTKFRRKDTAYDSPEHSGCPAARGQKESTEEATRSLESLAKRPFSKKPSGGDQSAGDTNISAQHFVCRKRTGSSQPSAEGAKELLALASGSTRRVDGEIDKNEHQEKFVGPSTIFVAKKSARIHEKTNSCAPAADSADVPKFAGQATAITDMPDTWHQVKEESADHHQPDSPTSVPAGKTRSRMQIKQDASPTGTVGAGGPNPGSKVKTSAELHPKALTSTDRNSELGSSASGSSLISAGQANKDETPLQPNQILFLVKLLNAVVDMLPYSAFKEPRPEQWKNFRDRCWKATHVSQFCNLLLGLSEQVKPQFHLPGWEKVRGAWTSSLGKISTFDEFREALMQYQKTCINFQLAQEMDTELVRWQDISVAGKGSSIQIAGKQTVKSNGQEGSILAMCGRKPLPGKGAPISKIFKKARDSLNSFADKLPYDALKDPDRRSWSVFRRQVQGVRSLRELCRWFFYLTESILPAVLKKRWKTDSVRWRDTVKNISTVDQFEQTLRMFEKKAIDFEAAKELSVNANNIRHSQVATFKREIPMPILFDICLENTTVVSSENGADVQQLQWTKGCAKIQKEQKKVGSGVQEEKQMAAKQTSGDMQTDRDVAVGCDTSSALKSGEGGDTKRAVCGINKLRAMLIKLGNHLPYSAMKDPNHDTWRKFKADVKACKSIRQLFDRLDFLYRNVRPELFTKEWAQRQREWLRVVRNGGESIEDFKKMCLELEKKGLDFFAAKQTVHEPPLAPLATVVQDVGMALQKKAKHKKQSARFVPCIPANVGSMQEQETSTRDPRDPARGSSKYAIAENQDVSAAAMGRAKKKKIKGILAASRKLLTKFADKLDYSCMKDPERSTWVRFRAEVNRSLDAAQLSEKLLYLHDLLRPCVFVKSWVRNHRDNWLAFVRTCSTLHDFQQALQSFKIAAIDWSAAKRTVDRNMDKDSAVQSLLEAKVSEPKWGQGTRADVLTDWIRWSEDVRYTADEHNLDPMAVQHVWCTSQMPSECGPAVIRQQAPHTPFKSIHKNLYRVQRPKADHDIHGPQMCNCDGTARVCDDHSCLNRAIYVECDPQCCPSGPSCANQQLQKREYPKVKVVYTQDRGHGVIADEPIKKDQLVHEYMGEVIHRRDWEKRLESYGEETPVYFFTLGSLFIDASEFGSVARFINHSCDANCHAEKWTVQMEDRVGIFASRDIEAGEELTYNYNFNSFGSRHKCACGSTNCTGFLGGISNETGGENCGSSSGGAKKSAPKPAVAASKGKTHK